MPSTPAEWQKVADEFEQLWNFPHAIGALDGKHCLLQAPFNAGSEFYNYKKSHSIVLMGLVNANYEFMYVDIGKSVLLPIHSYNCTIWQTTSGRNYQGWHIS